MKEQRRAIILLMVSLVMTGWWHWGNYNSSAPQVVTNNETSYQVLFWNVSYAKAGWPALIEEIQKYDADIIGMVEVGHGFRAEQDWLKDVFPDYQIQFLGHGFVLIRGDILSHKRGFLENHGGYGVVRARLNDGEELGIVLADIYAYPFMPRGPAFEALSKVLENETDQPVCLMGDFNTPPDSVFFNPLRETLEHSFEVAGNGYQVTWPIPVPVLCLDQIWLPEGGTRSAEYHTSPHSDHRLVVAQWLIPRAE
jgi:endonuclease/exonuclease/phosphatase (EEP) superfamily protein YafD